MQQTTDKTAKRAGSGIVAGRFQLLCTDVWICHVKVFPGTKLPNAESLKRRTAAEMWLTDGYEAAGKGDEKEKQQFWSETEHFAGARVWSL